MLNYDGIRIIKKDGTIQDFDPQKIISAITKSAQRVLIELSDEEFEGIVDNIINLIRDYEMTDVNIADMHKFVETTLDTLNPSIAKSYRDYRNYKIDFVHIMDKVYERSKAIRYIGDKENANTDSALVATKRSLIYNELNKRLYRRFFMTVEERQACRDGYIYIHDQSARLDSLNCCLCDVGKIMKHGFEMGNIWYNEPKSLDVAFDVLGDIIISTAAQQYGGFTVPEVDRIMAPYAVKSYNRYYREYRDIINREMEDDTPAHEYAMMKTKREAEQGYQGIEMKLNTVGSSRGDYPFITFTFGLAADDFGKMISKTILDVHREGQGKPGHKRPVLFPKLVFLYDEEKHGEGCDMEDVFETAIKCSSASMYPDYLSLTGEGYVPSMYKKYGRVVSPMGKCKSAHVKRYSTAWLSGCGLI